MVSDSIWKIYANGERAASSASRYFLFHLVGDGEEQWVGTYRRCAVRHQLNAAKDNAMKLSLIGLTDGDQMYV